MGPEVTAPGAGKDRHGRAYWEGFSAHLGQLPPLPCLASAFVVSLTSRYRLSAEFDRLPGRRYVLRGVRSKWVIRAMCVTVSRMDVISLRRRVSSISS
ncbi:hypothetical protein BH23ACT6_BH23ACT6_20340 [soil metagenome]